MAGFNVYVYPNTAGLPVEEPAAGLEETLDDIVSQSTVPSFNVEIIDINPNIEADSIYDMITPWRQWLQSNGTQGPGSHLLAAEGYGGIAGGAGEAWVRPMVCVSMLEDFVFSQEVLHNFIDSSLPEVRELGYPQDYEHSLGKVFEGGDVSPMTAGYVEDGHAAGGVCGREEQTQQNVLTPTECTILASEYSWEEHDGEGGGECGVETETTTESGFLAWWNAGDVYTYGTTTTNPCGIDIELDGPGAFANYDLYVTYDGREPTPTDYDDRSAGSGDTESISSALSGSTDVGVLVHANSGWGSYDLTINEQGQ